MNKQNDSALCGAAACGDAARAAFQQRIGYMFKNPSLLVRAATHSSYANEMNRRINTHMPHNENFEFLGDSVLGFIVADELLSKNPDKNEGWLTQIRAAVVCESSLTECARRLGVEDILIIGNNLYKERGNKKNSVLSDAMEAIFAAVYLDGGIEAARDVIARCLSDNIKAAESRGANADYKTRLQEYLFGADKNVKIKYEVTAESGPAHRRRFSSRVTVNGREAGSGDGASKKESEQNAAKMAFGKLDVSEKNRNTGL